MENSPEKDKQILLIVDSLSENALKEYEIFYPQDLKHYLSIQKRWIQDEIYFLGIKLGKDPTSQEIIDNKERNKNNLRFRAFYCMMYPDKVKK
jgi:hypothetical protein